MAGEMGQAEFLTLTTDAEKLVLGGQAAGVAGPATNKRLYGLLFKLLDTLAPKTTAETRTNIVWGIMESTASRDAFAASLTQALIKAGLSEDQASARVAALMLNGEPGSIKGIVGSLAKVHKSPAVARKVLGAALAEAAPELAGALGLAPQVPVPVAAGAPATAPTAPPTTPTTASTAPTAQTAPTTAPATPTATAQTAPTRGIRVVREQGGGVRAGGRVPSNTPAAATLHLGRARSPLPDTLEELAALFARRAGIPVRSPPQPSMLPTGPESPVQSAVRGPRPGPPSPPPTTPDLTEALAEIALGQKNPKLTEAADLGRTAGTAGQGAPEGPAGSAFGKGGVKGAMKRLTAFLGRLGQRGAAEMVGAPKTPSTFSKIMKGGGAAGAALLVVGSLLDILLTKQNLAQQKELLGQEGLPELQALQGYLNNRDRVRALSMMRSQYTPEQMALAAAGPGPSPAARDVFGVAAPAARDVFGVAAPAAGNGAAGLDGLLALIQGTPQAPLPGFTE